MAKDLDQIEDRLHIVEGLLLVLRNEDAPLGIRRAANRSNAVEYLQQSLQLSEIQALHVMAMTFSDQTLFGLTALEAERDALVEDLSAIRRSPS